MSDEFQVQVSVKLGQHMVNVRGDDWGTFKFNWDTFVEGSAAIAQDIAMVDAAYVLAAGLTPQQGTTTAKAAVSDGAMKADGGVEGDDPGVPAGPRPSCQHGSMKWANFTSKAGKQTQMWKCILDTGMNSPGACDAQWPQKKGR